MSRPPELPDWLVAWVCDAIVARCGLYFGGTHAAHLCGQIAARMQELGLGVGDYTRLLQQSPSDGGELQTLIERLCIHETSFLRDLNHFHALARFILPQLVREARRDGRRRVRLVSAGCSTGQEAYSIAMVVQESRPLLEELEVEVVGLDVSGDAIDKAARGLYPSREIAGLDPERLARYFRPVATDYEVTLTLRHAVRWLRCNITGLLPVTQVDVIFCRNVLIYFQGAQRDALVRNLVGGLRRGGFLVVGYADSMQAHRDILEPIRTNGTVIFRRTQHSAAMPRNEAEDAVLGAMAAGGARSAR